MILVTGFQSYGGRTLNPSEAVARVLDGTSLKGVPICARTLPVDFQMVRDTLPKMIDEIRPEIVLSLGLWPGEPMIRLERVAANWSHFELADNVGHRQNGTVIDDGPDAYLTTLPADDMQFSIRAAGIPCRQSGSAGTYLCNATSYIVLHHCRLQRPETRAGFMHLPYLPQQVVSLLDDIADSGDIEMHQRADFASMRLETMSTAVEIALETAVYMGP